MELITVLGPTACGKTAFAARLAFQLDGEVISADSRQVYRRMDLGTGKDYQDYVVEGKWIPCHLIDMVEPGYEYSVFEFQRDFIKAYQDVTGRGKKAVMCGGSGMYLESVIRAYQLEKVPEDPALRMRLAGMSMEEMERLLISLEQPHNTSDLTDRERLVRAIEIRMFERSHNEITRILHQMRHTIFGISISRESLRERITRRLHQRLEAGMVREVQALLEEGLTPGQLDFYGLEYRYITRYLMGETGWEEMVRVLNTAIHQFAKRQMTWFRRMERNGIPIFWINGELPPDQMFKAAMEVITGGK
ncbi:MAG: tRNA (adenosine(37)-N6)-dimethylallyltransferase MiaA [Bacteroidales bacterium]|nr:tRNA (adenosine(37)-N6)-dimethylallyltransferase MiaA [Bacteroidales bacterium]